jgi:hypothetical protein
VRQIGEPPRGEHSHTTAGLSSLATLLQAQGDLPAARLLLERALAIYEKTSGANNLAGLLQAENVKELYEDSVDYVT